MRRSSQIYILCFGFAVLAAGIALAQDFGATGGASSSAPPPAPPPAAPAAGNIRVAPDKTISANDYFIPCGQGCSFEAAQEAMAVLGFYFQSMKPSTSDVVSPTYRANVTACTRRAQGDRCDEQMFLESALHYNAAKQIRTAYLENATNREELRTLGTDKDTQVDPGSQESLNSKWFRREGTWAVVGDTVSTDIQEYRTRDNFQFNIDAFASRETELEKLQNVDPEFAAQYQAFFNRSTQFQDRYFAKARRQQASRRGLASDESDIYTLQSKDNSGELDLHEGIRRDVLRGAGGGNDSLRSASERAAEITSDPATGNRQFRNQPKIFESNDAYFELGKRRLDNLEQNLDTLIAEMRNPATDQTRRTEIQSEYLAMGVSSASLASLNRDQIKTELASERQRRTEQERNGSGSRQVAIDLNRRVATVAEQQRQSADATNRSANITLDVASFDAFVESIWPTEEGDRLVRELDQFRQSNRNRTTIGPAN